MKNLHCCVLILSGLDGEMRKVKESIRMFAKLIN